MMDGTGDDLALVVQAAAGDRAAFAAIIRAHYDLIYRTAYKWCGRREDAGDVAQEVCVRLGRSIRSFDGRSQFSTWLYQVVLNAVRDFQRRESRERKLRDAWAADPARPDRQEPQDDDAAEALWRAVRRLPARQCDAVLLVYAEGLSHAQAAKIMQCAEGTVSYHLHAARENLKTIMAADEGLAAGVER